MTETIHGKTIVITGASSGIGAAAAMRLAREGARVCLVARRADELERVRAAIEKDGGLAWAYPADLSDEKALDACAQKILAGHQRVDILINNAGRSIRRLVVESLDREHDFQRTMQINYFAAVRLTLRMLPRMLEQGAGHIINVSSMSAQVPTPRYAAYVASKSALEGFSRTLAAEMVDKGVHITVINYPLVKTPMTAPTKVYRYLRQMDVDKAAEWIVRAVRKRPYRIASRLGDTWGMATTALPGPTVEWTGRLFRFVGKRLERRARQSPD
ncbi:MAG TPA: SDR family NAD(P)-dependent oxidoreductase [Stenotrophobium sp.]|jgi:short-subunit dehydrogenase|nr:SDR family NAD(P)-dependent oxidoreductase [Stenotrophobium sp.]